MKSTEGTNQKLGVVKKMPDLNTVNSTTSAISTFAVAEGGFGSWFSVVASVGIITIIILLFVMALSSYQRYKKMKGILGWLIKTTTYFFIGCAGIVVLALPTYVAYYFINQARDGNVVPIWITLSIIGGYFVIAGLGYLFKRYILDKVKKYESQLNKGKRKKKDQAVRKTPVFV